MFYHQKVARVRVFADIQNFALCAHCVHGIPLKWETHGDLHAHCVHGIPLKWETHGELVT